MHVDLAPGERTELVFVVGEGETRTEAEALVAHWRDPARVAPALAALAERWDRLTGAVRVRSPDPAFDLPLIGTGDWNDGMDRFGRAGRGESVWLGWFRIAVISAFAPSAEARGEIARARRWRDHAEGLERAIAAQAWDGERFVRSFDDDGIAWGSSDSEECRIDVLAQAWSALVDCPDEARVCRALDSADAHLVDRAAKAALREPCRES